ncbi:ABC transporter permease [Azospirillum halopraeferens]|uniref:ABC transporter permease n=1 Tax=Azospirillum halopraeferens TaxID=34010 RepID=UPI00040C1518|nr:ABC transporter permease [Azospirillum halopraeferens]
MIANRFVRRALLAYLGLVLLFAFAPIAAGFVFSVNSDRFPSLPLGSFTLDWYRAVFEDALVVESFRNSLLVGLAAAPLATLIGFAAAYADYRFRFFGQRAVLVLGLLPPTIPVVILGVAMLAFLARLGLAGTLTAVIVCHVVVCAPFAMAVARLRFAQIDPDLEIAAQNLGASDWRAFAAVIVPMAWPALMAAMFLSLAVSFDEYMIAWFVGGLNETVPVRVLGFLQGQVSPRIHAIGAVSFLVSILLVALAQMLTSRMTRH